MAFVTKATLPLLKASFKCSAPIDPALYTLQRIIHYLHAITGKYCLPVAAYKIGVTL